MKIIFHTRSDTPEYNGDCDCAVVDMTPALFEQIQRRVKLAEEAFRQDDDLYELYFWGGTAEFYDHRLLDACAEAIAADMKDDTDAKDAAVVAWSDVLDQHGYAILPEGIDLDAQEIQSTEIDQMIVRRLPNPAGSDFEITWLASPKHADIYVTTSDLPLNALDAQTAAATLPQGTSIA